MNTRMLKISGISSYNYKSVPIIRLQGNWLRRLGFEIGGRIEVKGKKGLILIRFVPADDSRDNKGVQQK